MPVPPSQPPNLHRYRYTPFNLVDNWPYTITSRHFSSIAGFIPNMLAPKLSHKLNYYPDCSIFVDNYYSSRHADKLCCFPFPAGSNFNLPVSQLCHKINYYLNWHRRNKIKLFTTGPVPVTWPTPTTLVPIHQYNAFLSMTFIIILGMAKTVLQAQTDTG